MIESKNERQQQHRKKGLRKVISGMVTSFRNVITGIIPTTHTTSPDNIPLVDYVSTRGKKISRLEQGTMIDRYHLLCQVGLQKVS